LNVVVAPVARAEIREILSTTLAMFGTLKAARYADYIDRARRLLEEDPKRPSSRDRGDLVDGLRSLHLSVAAGRVAGAAHVIFYREHVEQSGERLVTIVRVLHERASPDRHLR